MTTTVYMNKKVLLTCYWALHVIDKHLRQEDIAEYIICFNPISVGGGIGRGSSGPGSRGVPF